MHFSKNPYVASSNFDLDPPEERFSIFDTPDQDEIFKKIRIMSTKAFVFGSYGVFCEMLLLSRPPTPAAILGRYASFIFPIVSMGAAYPAIVGMSASLRKKDDQYNHFLGGVVVGSIWGARFKNQRMAWSLGIGLGLTALLVKMAKMEGVNFMPPDAKYKNVGNFHHYHRTFIPGFNGRRPIEASDTPDRGIDSL